MDVLVTQFSYASWAGNRDDVDSRKAAAAAVVERLVSQCRVLQPRYVVLAASYVWFCHAENFHMNQTANRVGEVAREVATRSQSIPVVLYPGDRWIVGEPNDFELASKRYAQDIAALELSPPLTPERRVLEPELLEHGAAFVQRLIEQNRTIRLFLLPTARIYVTDLERHFTLSTSRGFRAAQGKLPSDVELGSDALDYAFRFGWGGETLLVSGRYGVPERGDFARFYAYFEISLGNSRSSSYPSVLDVARAKIGAALPSGVRRMARAVFRKFQRS